VAVDTIDLMRQDWDERARKDAFHYSRPDAMIGLPRLFSSPAKKIMIAWLPPYSTGSGGILKTARCWNWAVRSAA
jgi:hypothetical protein